jgi:ribosomal protein L39E
MDYKEPKKRVTKNDKKNRKEVYSQKHIRIKTEMIEKRKQNGSVPATECPLLPNGCK